MQVLQLGWTEGRNLKMDVRWAGDSFERTRMFAKELVDLQPDVILARGSPATAAFQRETRTISIVFVAVGDPVRSGFVAGLPRPGANITGFGDAATSWRFDVLIFSQSSVRAPDRYWLPERLAIIPSRPLRSASAKNLVPSALRWLLNAMSLWCGNISLRRALRSSSVSSRKSSPSRNIRSNAQ
jgi:ABC transporter substrate binding protein